MYLGDPGGFLRCEKKDPRGWGSRALHATTRTRSSHAYIYLIENPSVFMWTMPLHMPEDVDFSRAELAPYHLK